MMIGPLQRYLLLLSLTSPLLRDAVANSDATSSNTPRQVNDNKDAGTEGTRKLLDLGNLLPNDEDSLFGEQAPTEEVDEESSTTGENSIIEVITDEDDPSELTPPGPAVEVQDPEAAENDYQDTAGNASSTTEESLVGEDAAPTDLEESNQEDTQQTPPSPGPLKPETEEPEGELQEGTDASQVETETVDEDDLVPVPDYLPKPGDFERLNLLLVNTVIHLGDADIEEELLFQPIEVSMRDLQCSQVSFEDIALDSDERTNQTVSINFALVNLGIVCEFDFRWSYIFLSGSGHASVEIGDSSVTAEMELMSENFQHHPPANATIQKCETDINILGLDFSGNVAAQIFNLFESSIIEVLDEELNEKICVELKDIGAEMITEALDAGLGFVEPFLEPMEAWRTNISFPELTMEVPEDVDLVSWTDEDGGIGEFLGGALDQIDDTMGSLVKDDSIEYETPLFFPNGTQYPDGYDLGINALLRNYLLDDTRAFSLEEEIILYEGINTFTDTTLKLKQVKIVGLDTFTHFEPFTRVGNFTLQNALSWESLSLEAVLEMEVKASPLEDSIIRDAERVEPYFEEMTISVGVDDLVTGISVMVAFDPMKTAGVQIGSVLDLMTMLPCMAASLHDFVLAGLTVSIGNIHIPTIEGLVSKGVDRLLIDAVDLGFYMLNGPLLEAIPSFFETFVRDMVNDMFKQIQCPEFILPEEDSMVDLRDLILSPEEAKAAGALGKAQYGDLTHTIYGIGQNLWQEVNSDGTLGLNDFLISPLTEATSEESGLLRFPDRLYNFTTEGYDQVEFKTLVTRFEFAFYDLRVDNLDTVVHPMAIFQPVDHPYITQSTVNMGPLEDRHLNVSINMVMALDIVDSPLAMNNVINLGFSVASVEFFFELMTMLSTTKMLNFQLIDALNFDCMLNMMRRPEMNETGYAISDGGDQALQIRKLLARVSDLKLGIDCIECSPGVATFPEMVDIFDKYKVTDILGYRIPMFVEEIAISDALHATFDRWIYEAPYYCPSHEDYNYDYSRPEEWATPEFSDLSVEASDTIFFTSFALAEVAIVLLSETHYPWNLSSLEPLSTQEAFAPEEGSDMIDWTSLSEDFDLLADDARAYLAENRTDEKTKITDLGINHLMRNFLVDTDGVVEIMDFLPGDGLEFSVEGVVIFFHSIKIRGLDTFTRFDVLKPIAPQTILNSMHLRYLEIEVTVSTGSRTDPPQQIVSKLEFKDLNATVPLFAAFDRNKFNELELGHFLMADKIFDCILSVADTITFPQFLMSIGNFSVPTFEGFLPESSKALRESISEVYEKYAARALKAIPVMFDVTARQFVNTYIADYIDWATCSHIVKDARNRTLPGETPYPFTDFVDLRELIMYKPDAMEYGALGKNTYGTLVSSLLYPLQEDILWVNPKTNMSTNLNYALQTATSLIFGENGTLAFPGNLIEPFELIVEVGALMANVSFGLGDLRIENLDTMGDPLSFLKPVRSNKFELSNSVGAGLGGRPLRFSMRVSINMVMVDGNTGLVDQDIRNDMIVTMDMEQFQVIFQIFAKLSESRLIHFPMADIFNPSCWLALMPAPALDESGIRLEGEKSHLGFRDVMAAVENLDLTIACEYCSSSGMENLIEALAKNESKKAVTGIANALFGFGEDLTGGNLVQDALDRAVYDAGRYCPHDPKYDPDAHTLRWDSLNIDRSVATSSLLIMIITVGFSLIMVMLAITIIVKWVVKRRHNRWIRTLPATKVHILEHQQEADEQMENELNHDTSAMVAAAEIPKKVRYGMPILILGNIAFFLSGHFSIAAETAFEAKVAGESFTLDRFFSFSIMKSTVDMWEAGATEMAIFLLIFSGIWPYVKQFISLVCWFCPPTKLSISTRGSTFLWLDTLAKWSMVDIFVMFVSMVSFRVNAITPDVPYLPQDFFSLSLIIIPRWGLYANLIAQLISQVSSHFIIYYHRAIVRRASRKYVARHAAEVERSSVQTAKEDDHSGNTDEDKGDLDDSDEQSRLCDGAFARPHKGESSKLVARQIASYGLVVGTFLLIVFFIIGCSLPSLNVQIQGAISFVSGAGDGVYKEFNVWGIAKQLMRDALNLGGGVHIAGYLLLIIVAVATIFIVPVLQALALAFHWFRPMNDKERKTFSSIIEILAAWQYAEVFIFALIVASWQLAPTSETIMADQCNEFEEFFGILAYYGILDFQDSHCFRVEATIMNGAYLLVSGAVLLAILNSFVMKASYQYYWDKDCCRKEMAVKNHLTEEEAATPVDDVLLKGIHPPPVLFTDTFRWLLRPEHLGDIPLQGIVVEEQSQETLKNDDQENTSTESPAAQDVPENTGSSIESPAQIEQDFVDC